MTTTQPNIKLLQAEVDETDESYLRLLINNETIKYITINPGIYSDEDMCFEPSLLTILPPFPSGPWNDGLIDKDPSTGQGYFAYTRQTTFPGVKSTWHKTFIEYTSLQICQKLRTGIYEAQTPDSSDILVAKFARFDWEIGYLETETRAYNWIEGQGIGPAFYGHIMEDGRVIGFLMERITGARHAGPQDLEACREVLGRLHGLGIRHGDVNGFNFLVQDSKAVLIDFDTARRCEDHSVLGEEMEGLAGSLRDSSGRGGGGLLV